MHTHCDILCTQAGTLHSQWIIHTWRVSLEPYHLQQRQVLSLSLRIPCQAWIVPFVPRTQRCDEQIASASDYNSVIFSDLSPWICTSRRWSRCTYVDRMMHICIHTFEKPCSFWLWESGNKAAESNRLANLCYDPLRLQGHCGASCKCATIDYSVVCYVTGQT